MYYAKQYNIIIIIMAFCAFSTIGKGAMMGSNFVPPPTSLLYTALSATVSSVTISFTMASIPGIITYIPSKVTGTGNPSIATGTGTPSAYIISGLSPNTSYNITLTANNNGVSSKPSSPVLTVLTVPGPPTIGTATVTDSTHVSVAFTAPSGTGTITGYTVTSSPGSFTGTGTTSPITVTATFVSGTAYTFTVTATNSSGTSTASSASAGVTPSVSNLASVYAAGLMWTIYYNNFGAGNYLSNSGTGTSGGGTGVALTIAPIGTTWSSNSNTAISQNTGITSDFTSLTTATNSVMPANSSSHKFSVEWVGYFLANATGTWTFSTQSDDGSWLWIDNDTTQNAYTGYNNTNATVNNSPDQGMTTRSGTASLTSGKYYFIRIQFNENGGGYDINVKATNPSGTTIGPNLSGYVFQKYDGLSAASAAPSASYLAATGNITNGTYWINLPTVGPTQIYCILDPAVDGGGWMMAMKATRGTTFNYSSNYWTTNNTLNPTDTNRNDGDAKFNTMNYSTATDILALWPDITTVGGSLNLTSYGCWSWLQKNFTSAGTLYGSGQGASTTTVSGITSSMTLINWFNTISSVRCFIQDAITWPGWGNATNHIFSSQTDVRFYGFNYYDNAGTGSGNSMRWGFGWNENGGGLFPNGDMGSDDIRGGIGMSSSYFSAGDNIGCCQTVTGINRSARVEIYIR